MCVKEMRTHFFKYRGRNPFISEAETVFFLTHVTPELEHTKPLGRGGGCLNGISPSFPRIGKARGRIQVSQRPSKSDRDGNNISSRLPHSSSAPCSPGETSAFEEHVYSNATRLRKPKAIQYTVNAGLEIYMRITAMSMYAFDLERRAATANAFPCGRKRQSVRSAARFGE